MDFDLFFSFIFTFQFHNECFTAGGIVADVFGKSHKDGVIILDSFAISKFAEKHNTCLDASIVMGKCKWRQADHCKNLKVFKYPVAYTL